jgi:phosphoribosylglycinamide formyltransferase-1
MTPPRLAVLISGRGRNLGALLDATRDGRIPAQPVAVIANVDDAPGLALARAAGVPAVSVSHRAFDDRAAFDAALAQCLRECRADIVALAGFMRVLGDAFVREFEGRMLNIHPSLLPKYRGLHTHARALAAGDREHGATVHFVTPQLDGGPAIIQGRLSVGPEDDEHTLAQRVLERIELKIYPQAVAWMARGEIVLREGRVHFRGAPLVHALGLDDLEPEFR